MPQPAVQAPVWQTWPEPQVLCSASLDGDQAVVLRVGWQDWQGPLVVPES